MPSNLRLRGQEVLVRIIANSVILATITAVKSLTVTVKTAILSEGYAGETTERKDDIFKGIGFELLVHPEDEAMFNLVQLIIDRSQRRTAAANATVDITATMNFPSGKRVRCTIKDAKFADIALGLVNARDAYSDGRFPGEAERMLIAA